MCSLKRAIPAIFHWSTLSQKALNRQWNGKKTNESNLHENDPHATTFILSLSLFLVLFLSLSFSVSLALSPPWHTHTTQIWHYKARFHVGTDVVYCGECQQTKKKTKTWHIVIWALLLSWTDLVIYKRHCGLLSLALSLSLSCSLSLDNAALNALSTPNLSIVEFITGLVDLKRSWVRRMVLARTREEYWPSLYYRHMLYCS